MPGGIFCGLTAWETPGVWPDFSAAPQSGLWKRPHQRLPASDFPEFLRRHRTVPPKRMGLRRKTAGRQKASNPAPSGSPPKHRTVRFLRAFPAARGINHLPRLPWVQELARLREKALHDEASALGHARREGEQIGMEKGEKIGIEKGEKIGIEKGERIGIEKGKEEERANIAARLKELGLSDDMIKAALNK